MTELQCRMTAVDAAKLRLYRNKTGPLNPTLRAEVGHAQITAAVLNTAKLKHADGRPFTQTDFLPWMKDEPKDEPQEAVATVQEVFQIFQSLARKKELK